jgi:tricorn protease
MRGVGLLLAALVMMLAGVASAQTPTQAPTGPVPRYPDVHDDMIVFTHAGDLWRVSGQGGLAVRLTAHPGLELFAKVSPDGRWIAFTGQYDGDEQVYVIPATGGEPRKLTHYPARGPLPPRWGFDNQVMGWTPDGSAVLFRSVMDGVELTDSRLYTVPMAGGVPTPLEMPVSGAGTLSPDGSQVLYSPLFRDFRTWKRYEGGWAQDLWLFDRKTKAARNLTNHVRTDRDPMWLASGLYFVSDRSGILNLYTVDAGSAAVTALTQFTAGDVNWASAGPGGGSGSGQIVFERNGRLTLFDVASRQSREVAITVPEDGLYTRPFDADASRQMTGFDIGPKGARAIVVGRGDIFSVAVERGVTRNLTNSSNAHDREAALSPDGRTVAFISDATGEEEVWLVAEDGRSAARQLTRGNRTRLYGPRWSPDGKSLLVSAKTGLLMAVDAGTGSQRTVDQAGSGVIGDAMWSPDSRHVAYSLPNPSGFRQIFIWTAADGQKRAATSAMFDASEPVWGRDGKQLFFFSRREFAPLISQVDQTYALDNQVGIFALNLTRGTPNLFPLVDGAGDDTGTIEVSSAKKPAAKSSGAATTAIDWDGLAARVTRVPVSPGNYGNLQAVDGGLVYQVRGSFYLGRQPTTTRLERYDFKERDDRIITDDADGYTVSQDGSTLLVLTNGSLRTFKPGSSDRGKAVALDGMVMRVDPRQEWRVAFDEVWRRFRDFFYVETMHGYDWAAIGARYRAKLPGIAHRSELSQMLGEMIAELNAGHAYIDGGDTRLPRRPQVGLLGARFTIDPATNRYRIARILQGHNEEFKYRSPLTEVGVNAKVGDYILAINGRPLVAPTSPHELLRNHAGDVVELMISPTPDMAQARSVAVRTIASETSLLYLDWVLGRQEYVRARTQGRVGYLHIPDMGDDGAYEFIKWFYPQIRQDGLIVDVRTNGGGWISQMLLERLRRSLLAVDHVRDARFTATYPNTVFTGPMVAIADEDTASDGDIFTYMFQKTGLGPVIGKRTWGGVVGITDHGPLIDGGRVSVPEFATADTQGRYIIEGEGVRPDIEVEQDPARVIAGEDPQLDRAIAEVLARMKTRPAALPGRPADPIKTK